MNINYYLKILQLEGYRPTRFLRWVWRNYAVMFAEKGEDPVWTPKALLLHRLAMGSIVFVCFLAAFRSLFLAVILGIALYVNFFIPLLFAWCLIRPYELYNRKRVAESIRKKILSFDSLCVIGITGSYGKTSTKMVLHELLPRCLMTPKSYNTLFGIWKVVDYEVSKVFRYFICEMGAYKRGDVREFCELTLPHLGILTGINEQHLERFGSIENTTQAKFEITQFLRPGATAIVNLDNQRIRDNLSLAHVPLIGYSVDGYTSDTCQYVVGISSWTVENFQTRFTITYKDAEYEGQTALIGRAHLSNILASFTAATFLGEPVEELLARIALLKQVPHRLECKREQGYTLLDNSYSSNPSAFRDSIDALSRFPGHKVLITPGLVELGDISDEVHVALGSLAAEVCDEIVLVGDTDKTKALRRGLGEKGFSTTQIQVLRSRNEMLEYLGTKAHTGQVVLIENDLPDQYL